MSKSKKLFESIQNNPPISLEDFINNTVIGDLGIMVETPQLKYLSFFVMSSVIEFLGACLDIDDFNKKGKSGARFKKAINELESLKEYRELNRNEIDLYAELRCGLLHAGIPQSHIELTERKDKNCGKMHLKPCTLKYRKTNPRWILVCEDLYCDIRNAAKEVITKMKADQEGKYKDAKMPFLATDTSIAGTP